MGGINVKNTIVERLFKIIAPHYCFGCGKVGTLICPNCKYDIIHEPFLGCFLCARPEKLGICSQHRSPVTYAHIVGVRDGALQVAIDRLKFQNLKQAAVSLAELLNETLPVLPAGTVIVPLPTILPHIRQRGYDQVELIARQLGYIRGISVEKLLKRRNKAVQHKADRAQREGQIKGAFELVAASDASNGVTGMPGAPILLLDDIITTGSSVSEAAKVLAKTGRPIWVAALAYQPLD